LLFLGAGSVMHAMGGVIDMRQFSGLKRILPWTCLTFWAGALALAGFPLLSGFWSKDEIIHHAFTQHAWLGWLGLITAVLTAFYTFRMVFTAFHGDERVPQGAHPHESGKWMLVPLCLLAVGAIGAGYVNVGVHAGGFLGFLEPGGPFGRFLAPALASFDAAGHGAETVGHAAEAASAAEPGGYGLMYLSAVLAIVGIAAAWWLYVERRDLPVRIARAMPAAYDLSYHKYYVDEGYQAGVVEPLRKGGRLCYGIDDYFIDGIVWLVTAIPRLIAFLLRSFQSGSLQGYATTMAAGFAIILLWVLLTS
jgi:NADH-quinone oxidoreductase subunit L